MIALVRVGSMEEWGRLIAAVEEALRLGVGCHFTLEHGVVEEPVQVRYPLAAAFMLHQAALLKLGPVSLHLPRGLAQFRSHCVEGIPEGAIRADPAHTTLIKALLPVS